MFLHIEDEHAKILEIYLRESIERQPWVFAYAQAFVHVAEDLARERERREELEKENAAQAKLNSNIANTSDPVGFDPDSTR